VGDGVANKNARALRKNLTPQEAMLWVRLRGLKPLGYHFRRQAPIRHLIVDFASFRDGLVIEIDGGQHGMAPGARQDAARDAFLRGEGFRVLRFWNSEVNQNLDGVMQEIWRVLHDPHPAGSGLRAADRCNHPGVDAPALPRH
jgi:very-short-patch-repair endonuclease